jgi:hypothetical protein
MKQTARVAAFVAAFILLSLPSAALAQGGGSNQNNSVIRGMGVYCAGFISDAQVAERLQVVGGEKENIRDSFAQGDVVYLDKGREQGIQSGAVYSVIRPLGEVKHPFTGKKIGYFVREVGLLQVIETHAQTATAEVMISCDTIELGDLLKPYEETAAPAPGDARPLPRYTEGHGRTKGQIIMSKNSSEYLAANQIVYLDLGNKQGLRPGDYLTIYRHIGSSERVASGPSDNVVQERSSGYGSDHYRGGDFSMSSTRVPRKDVVRKRPELPRKVMGELIVLRVERNSAVALITRTVAEVNIGDFVEPAN